MLLLLGVVAHVFAAGQTATLARRNIAHVEGRGADPGERSIVER